MVLRPGGVVEDDFTAEGAESAEKNIVVENCVLSALSAPSAANPVFLDPIEMTSAVPFAAIAFRGWFPWWLALPVLLLAAAGVVFLYLSESKRVPLVTRMLLAGLRALLVATVLFLILRPTWLTETRGDRYRPIGLLIDASASMKADDPRPNFSDQWRVAIATGAAPPEQPIPDSSGGVPANVPTKPTRWDVAKAALTNPKLDLTGKLRALGPLEAAAFGTTRDGLDPLSANWLNGVKPDKPRTALADAAFELLTRDENQLPAAVVLVTDGRENASGRSLDDLAKECSRLGVPLHVYGVGSSSFGQLQIRDVLAQDTLFVDDTAVVPVRFRSKGFAGGKVEFKLLLNGREVGSESVDAADGDDLRAAVKFVPTKADAETSGKQELKVVARYIGDGGEPVTDELSKAVKVVDRKLKVLSIDAQPRWDFKFIQRGLMRDRRCEPKFILTDGDPKAMKSGEPFLPSFPATRQELLGYDLLILGDIPAAYLTQEQQGWVRDFVAEGGGLIQIAGKANGPASFVGTPLADVLPVEFDSAKFKMDPNARTTGFRPRPTPLGDRSALLSLDDNPKDSKQVWESLPPIQWFFPVKKLKPAAEVLLVHPSERLPNGDPMPLLAAHYYGKGYVLFAGFDETWRWRRNEADKYFFRFWSQAIYAAGVPRTLGTKMTQLSLDTPDPALGSTGQVYARLLDANLRPVKVEKITATAERVDSADSDRSTKVVLNALPNHPGEFVATIPFNREGRFTLKVENGDDTATLDYRVSLPANHELAPGGMAEEEMRKLAAGSGGKFYREEDLHKLPSDIQRKTTPFVQKEEIVLWNGWMLLLVIALFAAEWTVRKLNSLS